jgi:Bacteriophage lambda head decoration protein D
MLLTDSYGIFPGLTTSRETYENEFRWGSEFLAVIGNAIISGNTIDAGNSPTFELRPGLVLGQQIATGQYLQYNPSATDGTEVASAVLLEGLRTLDFSNNPVTRFYGVLLGGPVKAANLYGLDYNARQQMDKFFFDDLFNGPGGHWFPWKRFQTKAANYSCVYTDNYTLFDNTGATGTVQITLPPIANGYYFGFRTTNSQIIQAVSNEGGNMITTSLTGNSASVTAIGGLFVVYTNPQGTKWIIEDRGNQTISYT